MSATVAASHAARKEKLKFALKDVTMLTTVGTGTFGRVRVVQYKPTKQYFAMKILKKSEVRVGRGSSQQLCWDCRVPRRLASVPSRWASGE